MTIEQGLINTALLGAYYLTIEQEPIDTVLWCLRCAKAKSETKKPPGYIILASTGDQKRM